LIRLRYEGGRENKGALFLIQASARDADFGVAQGGRNLRVAQRQMARTLGRGETDPIQVAGKLEADPPSGEADFKALAIETPTHRKAVAQFRYARAGLASAKSQYYPELSANASASKTGDHWMPDQDEWFLGLTLTYPFFLGGKSIMNVHAAEALMMQFEQNLKSTDAQLVLTLDQAWADYENAVEKTEVQSGFLKAQEIRAEIARSQYAAGLFSFEDWDRIENDLISAQKDYLSGRRDAVISEANWEKVQGKSRLPEI
jgi:outer membrane protein TolC